MKKIIIFSLFVASMFVLASCGGQSDKDVKALDSLNSQLDKALNDLNATETVPVEAVEVPFEINVLEHKFFNLKWYNGEVAFNFIAEITNKTNKSIVSAKAEKETGETKDLFGEKYPVTESPYILITFDNKEIQLGISIYNPDVVHAGGEFESENISDGSPWEPNTIKTLRLCFEGPDLKIIQFNYTPQKCVLVIPITVKDPIGYKFSDYLKTYDILDDWKSFQQEISKFKK